MSCVYNDELNRLSLGPQVHEALPQSSAIVPGGNLDQSRRLDGGGQRGLCRLCDRRQVATIDDDFLDRDHARWHFRLRAKLLAQGWTIRLISAGDRELIS